MDSVGLDAEVADPLGEFHGEHDVGQLGHVESLLAVVPLLPLEVVPPDSLGERVGPVGHGDDPEKRCMNYPRNCPV